MTLASRFLQVDQPGLLARVRSLLEVLRLPATISGSPETICFQASVEGRHWFILVTVTVTSELLVTNTQSVLSVSMFTFSLSPEAVCNLGQEQPKSACGPVLT